ncbi:bifunctional phosphoribosylaminoimidazolecarboxamide formyltransferase/IMP cyclohydrolase [Sporanaerobium hydrogeniformans]|uniref:bifunctional phosphoribosylaminoimidazolecarboxamide formyltransferase/IMP cyclohydrolase n=1 Tax=Sporanaerobium hydrogeniformans TaxID=3072179 RepID=UPI0026850F83|nr:bifunctional phosphoribosylaminoimidazolecarboxamide formyltransferase/IMP cyclohydrolase [Sporanaerobium hydrogeniformans]
MRALISVSDKTGIVAFAKALRELGVEIISTGGTYHTLQQEGVEVIGISEVTGFPECLDGRVKTLHPAIHAGLLNIRANEEHQKQMKELGLENIDMVVVNLYPFKATILKPDVTLKEAIENIDIGGPTMLRSAAKNNQDVAVIVDPADYAVVLNELKANKEVSTETKFYLATKVFEHTANYDSMIATYLRKQRGDYSLPEKFTMTFEKVQDMRYGENPHQQAAFYQEVGATKGTLAAAKQLNGKELSYNNINDANGALELLKEFTEPTIVAVKHANPCGVGSGKTIFEAYKKAYKADPISIFGGIVVSNQNIDKQTAEEMAKIFLEIVIAPSYDEAALEVLCAKKNLRVLQLDHIDYVNPHMLDMKKVGGGLIVQDKDLTLLVEEDLKVVTDRAPSEEEMKDLLFAWKLVKHVKSNGIALAKEGQSIGMGGGQTNRIWATKQALEHGLEFLGKEGVKGSVLASDAFFPFDDCVKAAVEYGITAIIQPGGSVRDEDSIKVCNAHNIAMLFTGMRHFKH